ncbi:MAG: hypothetical protein JNL90_17105 [Planctomycetes bacterium]|nr:hypothetical protein [Planctomycetota bacterium]
MTLHRARRFAAALSASLLLVAAPLAHGLALAPANGPASGLAPHDAARARATPDTTAAGFWSDFAASRKYSLKALRNGDLLVLLPQEKSKPERALERIEQALARFDAILPAAPPTSPPTTAQKASAASSELWGTSDRPLESGTMVMALFRKPADFAEALTLLGEAFPYMAAWTTSAKGQPGCILERPLFGACVDNVPGMQEWNPDNELVHRVAQLALIRRFGRQPVWVGLGVGWNVEFDVLKNIYCFPWRDSFVWATEHGGWENDLRRAWKKRGSEAVPMAELAAIKRGGFAVEDAALCWGFVRFLVRHHGERLPALLREFDAQRAVLGRVPTGDGKNWTMAADYELSAEEQQKAVVQLVAPDALQQAADWFRLGASWKKPAAAKATAKAEPKSNR